MNKPLRKMWVAWVSKHSMIEWRRRTNQWTYTIKSVNQIVSPHKSINNYHPPLRFWLLETLSRISIKHPCPHNVRWQSLRMCQSSLDVRRDPSKRAPPSPTSNIFNRLLLSRLNPCPAKNPMRGLMPSRPLIINSSSNSCYKPKTFRASSVSLPSSWST